VWGDDGGGVGDEGFCIAKGETGLPTWVVLSNILSLVSLFGGVIRFQSQHLTPPKSSYPWFEVH
jgi:hypothetical protein